MREGWITGIREDKQNVLSSFSALSSSNSPLNWAVLSLPLCLFSPILWAVWRVVLRLCLRVPLPEFISRKAWAEMLEGRRWQHCLTWAWPWIWGRVEIHPLLWSMKKARSRREFFYIDDQNHFQVVQAPLLGNRPLSRRCFHWCQPSRLTVHYLSMVSGLFSLPAFFMTIKYTPSGLLMSWW